MQHQARGRRRCQRIAVKRVTDDGVVDRLQVKPQLVRPAGDRLQFEAGGLRERVPREYAVVRQRRLALHRVDPLPGPVLPVSAQGQFDRTAVLRKQVNSHAADAPRIVVSERCR